MLDAIRPHVEWTLGPRVIVVVDDLRVSGDDGFASLQAKRPGGGEIDLETTPGARRGGFDPQMSDGASVQALLQRSGRVWVATHHAIGATDVWRAWVAFCPVWAAVLPETCGN